MCNNKFNEAERKVWEKRGEYAVSILTGMSIEEVAAKFETTVEFIEAEIEAIKTENPAAYTQVMEKLAANNH